MYKRQELSSLTISGGTVEKPVYGNLVFDKNFVKIAENGSATIGVKLDTKPTQNQTAVQDIYTYIYCSLDF